LVVINPFQVPFLFLYKEEPEICISEDHICRYIIAAKPAAIPALPSTFKQFDKCRSSHLLFFKAVFGSTFLPDFYHTQVMTSDMSGADKTNDLRAGEPTVGQYIIKTDTFSDGTGYHGYHQLDLTLFIFGCSGSHWRFLIPLFSIAGGKFLTTHTVVFLFTFFAKEGEVKNKLTFTISNTQEKRFEAKDSFVLQMRIHSANILYAFPCFWEIGIVHHQTDRILMMVTSHTDLVPYLKGEVVKYFTPVKSVTINKPIENVLFATKEVA